MKNLFKLGIMVILLAANQSFASGKNDHGNRKSEKLVAVPKLMLGNPQELESPYLLNVKAKNAFVAVAPFDYGSPADDLKVIRALQFDKKSRIPLAPFNLGNPQDLFPESIARIKATNADLPVVPFELGSPSELPIIAMN